MVLKIQEANQGLRREIAAKQYKLFLIEVRAGNVKLIFQNQEDDTDNTNKGTGRGR